VESGSGPGGRWFKSIRPTTSIRISDLQHTKNPMCAWSRARRSTAQIHLPRRFFPLSNQCVTVRSQLRLPFFFADNTDNICGPAWIFHAPTEIAKFRGHRWTRCGWPSGDGVYAYGSNVAGPRADGVDQESLFAEQHWLENSLAMRRAE
jgi:hypothetical protein